MSWKIAGFLRSSQSGKQGCQEALREAGDAPGELVRVAKERIFTARSPVCDRGAALAPGPVLQVVPGSAPDLLSGGVNRRTIFYQKIAGSCLTG